MHALARGDDGSHRGVVHAANGVAEGSGGVDDHLGPQLEFGAAFEVAGHHALHESSGTSHQPIDSGIVHQCGSLPGRGACQCDQQAGVIELPVEVLDPTAQSVGFQCGNERQGLLAREDSGRSEAVLPGQCVIDLHPDPVERGLPPIVVGDDEAEIVDQVGGIVPQEPALLQGFQHQRDVALLQVPHAAVDQFGGAARGAFAEVALFQEHGVVSPRRGVDGDAHARSTTADDQNVPGASVIRNPGQHLGAVHRECGVRSAECSSVMT